ncbi:MAG: hypothetical protein HY709_06650 [Candidatus Latescibacteria bacterium]|nr:hypothetical protein [Candidatus Latescibacterota bacterium]
MPTEADIIKGIRVFGGYNAVVGSEVEARRLLQRAMPDAVELPPVVSGQPYPKPPIGCTKWYQLHPPEPWVGHNRPHFKYEDWTRGKKGQGGSWGHIEF